MRKIRRVLNKPRQFLVNIFSRNLWLKIALVIFLLVAVSMAGLGILLMRTSQEAVKNSVLNRQKEIARRAAQEIELFIKGPQDILATTAAMFDITGASSWKQETVLVELALSKPVFLRVASFDLTGREIATSELGKKDKKNYPEEMFETVRAGKSYVSKVKILDSQTPYLTMAVPIKEMSGIAGFLAADVDLRGIWNIVDNIKLDETGRAFVVAESGLLIAHYDKKRVLKKESLKNEPEVAAVLAGKTEAVLALDNSGEGWINAYAPVGGLGWGLVIKQARKEAFMFSRVMQTQSWIIIIISELVAIGSSVVIARQLAQPINFLSGRIYKMAEGDFSRKIEIRRKDEIGRLARSINDMTEKLSKAKSRERLSAIGEATAVISHKFKNSLVSIKPFMQLLPRKAEDKEFLSAFSRLIPQEIARWEKMLKELSEFSSHYELKLVETDLKALVENILEIMAERIAQNNISARFYCPKEKVSVFADPERLRDVFINLIVNAINAMPEGGALEVNVSRKQEPRKDAPAYAEVSFKDSGTGIAPDALGKIFEPFYTTGNGGMGLGLAVSQKIIDLHAGEIAVKSELAKGTTFTIRLPFGRL